MERVGLQSTGPHAPVHVAKLRSGAPVATGSVDLSSDFERAVRAHAAHYTALAAREGLRLNGAGEPDRGLAQQRALAAWKVELQNVYAALDTSLNRGVLDWLLPLAEHLGSLLDKTGQLHTMQQRYGILVEAARQLASPQLEIIAQLGLCRAWWRQGNLAAAAAAGEAALNLSGARGDELSAARALNVLGNVRWQRGDFDQALELFSQSLEVMQRRGDELGAATALNNMGVVHEHRGESDRALALYPLCLEARQRLGDELGAGETLNNMGTAHWRRGEIDRALDLYAQSLDVRQRLGDELGAARTRGNLGLVHQQRGEPDQALELYAQILEVFRRLGDELGAALALGNMGVVHQQRGDLDRALKLYAWRLEVTRRLGAKTEMADTCADAAVALAGLGRWRPAAVTLYSVLARGGELGYRFEDSSQLNECLAQLDAAVAAGEIRADELKRWKSEGEALSLEKLVEATLSAISDATADRDTNWRRSMS